MYMYVFVEYICIHLYISICTHVCVCAPTCLHPIYIYIYICTYAYVLRVVVRLPTELCLRGLCVMFGKGVVQVCFFRKVPAARAQGGSGQVVTVQILVWFVSGAAVRM